MDRRKEATRQLLKGSGQATLAGVAEHLEVSKQGAIQHPEALEAAGLVVRSSETHGRSGRPEHLYRLTAAAAEHFPHAHRELAAELVQFMAADQVERFFAERAARRETDFVHVLVNGNFVKSGGPEIAAELEKSGYAEWGAEPDAAIPQEVF